MLTQRAQQYLATFERHPAVPLDQIEKWFSQTGQPLFEAWRTFHERYAGLKDRQSGYVLGLARPGDTLDGDHPPPVECDDWGSQCYVHVAKTEGFEVYEMSSQGAVTFNGQRADSFERKLERDALLWEAKQSGKAKYLSDDELCQSLLPQLEQSWVPEASDKYVDCYLSNRYLLFVNARTRYVDDVYEFLGAGFASVSGLGRAVKPTFQREGASAAFLPISVDTSYTLSDDPYKRLVQRLSLLGNLPNWEPANVERALGVALVPHIDDPSDPERRYGASGSDVFEKVRFILPTHDSDMNFMLSLTPLQLPIAEPNLALAPILPRDSQAWLAWPEKQKDKTPKEHGRSVQIGDTEVDFCFAGDDFSGPQRVTAVGLTRPSKQAPEGRYNLTKYRADVLSDGTEYAISRIDDGSRAVHVLEMLENPDEPNRLSISFRCLDSQLTIQEGSRLINLLIVQGLRREQYLGRIEYLDYTEVDAELEYTRLWNQRAG